MDLERTTSHYYSHLIWDGLTDRQDTHTHLPTWCTSWTPDVAFGRFQKQNHQRRSVHPYRGYSTESPEGWLPNPASWPYRHYPQILLRFPASWNDGETLQSKAFFANKILQPLFKIKHKLASLVRQQADSIPLCRASFIYIKFNTVSSSQSDNRVRELN